MYYNSWIDLMHYFFWFLSLRRLWTILYPGIKYFPGQTNKHGHTNGHTDMTIIMTCNFIFK